VEGEKLNSLFKASFKCGGEKSHFTIYFPLWETKEQKE
jgi:hypothetical protein